MKNVTVQRTAAIFVSLINIFISARQQHPVIWPWPSSFLFLWGFTLIKKNKRQKKDLLFSADFYIVYCLLENYGDSWQTSELKQPVLGCCDDTAAYSHTNADALENVNKANPCFLPQDLQHAVFSSFLLLFVFNDRKKGFVFWAIKD